MFTSTKKPEHRATEQGIRPASASFVFPPALREAFSLLLALDFREARESLQPKTIAFLEAFRHVAAEPSRELTNGVLRYCLEARAHEQKGGTLPTSGGIARLTSFPDEMWHGLDGRRNPPRYYSAKGPIQDDGFGSRAFQRDFLLHIDALLTRVRAEDVLADDLKIVSSELAGSLMVIKRKQFLEKALDDAVPADETTAVLHAAGEISPDNLKMFTTELAKPKNLPLRNAWGAVLRRLQNSQSTISQDTLDELSAWAKDGTPFELSELSAAKQHETLRALETLMQHLKSAGLEESQEVQAYALLARQWEICLRVANEEPDHEFAKAAASARLNARELKDIMDAADLLRAEGLQGLTVEVDRSPFIWPRIAEALLLGEPRCLTLHGTSPLASVNTSNETVRHVPYFVHRGTHHLPISCSLPIHDLISNEVYTAYRARPLWTTPEHGIVQEQGHTTTVSFGPSLVASSRIKELLKLRTLPAASFLISVPQGSEEVAPKVLAFGVFFHPVLRDIPGFKRHDFGKTLHLFVATDKTIPLVYPEPRTLEPEVTTPTVELQPGVVATLPPPNTPQPQRTAAPKKLPIPKEPRPTISEDHALSAKVALLSIPDIQTKAQQSHTLHPTIPFKEASLMATLNILKNGERPGSKGLKELRTYVLDDRNFRDCAYHAELVRTTLKTLLSDLLG